MAILVDSGMGSNDRASTGLGLRSGGYRRVQVKCVKVSGTGFRARDAWADLGCRLFG